MEVQFITGNIQNVEVSVSVDLEALKGQLERILPGDFLTMESPISQALGGGKVIYHMMFKQKSDGRQA